MKKGKENQNKSKKKTNKKFIIILSIMVMAGVIIGIYVYIRSLAHQTTNDAQVKSNMIPIIPHVSGYIDKVFVNDNQYVKKGDTLFSIESQDYEVQLAQAKATLAQTKSQLAVSKAGIGSSQANYLASQSQVSSAVGSIETAKIRLRRLSNDFERYKNLYKNHSITTQKYEQALAAKQEAQKQLEIMKDRKKTSQSQSHAASNQTEITQKQIAVARAKVESAQAMVEKAKLDIDYTTVIASIDGQLSAVDLQKGQFVSPGQSLFFLVNSKKKWVVANYKETQLTKIKPGQEVEIKVDAFSNIKFKGKVQSLSPATGARFSLLPPDNATGNFVKTVQRLPVKIIFTNENKAEDLQKLRSGMNANVDVHIK